MKDIVTQRMPSAKLKKAGIYSSGKSRTSEDGGIRAAVGTPLYLQRHFQRLPQAQCQCEAREDEQQMQKAKQFPTPIQAELIVGAADDPFEREADEVADRVMLMPSPVVGIDRGTAPSEHCQQLSIRDKLELQPRQGQERRHPLTQSESPGDSYISPNVEKFIQFLPAHGQPLPESVRSFMEPRFDHDFSRVRVHTDAAADASARSVRAIAYTMGQQIVFRAGAFAPETTDGRRLLAHELTHVVQQTGRSDLGLQQSLDNGRSDQGAAQEIPRGQEGVELGGPNQAKRTCRDICEKCESSKSCSANESNIKALFQAAANNVATAINRFGSPEKSDASRVSAALKDNFGSDSADVRKAVGDKLQIALGKFADVLCYKCAENCPASAYAQIVNDASGKPCWDYNCIRICTDKLSDAAEMTQALVHEIMHRVLRNTRIEIYKNSAPMWPLLPGVALQNADSFAWLVRDLL